MPRDPLSEKAVIGFPHGDRFHPAFGISLADLARWDAKNARRLVDGQWLISTQTTNLPNARNLIVRRFLEDTTADWLWFIDSDQDFEPDTLERLILSADPDERPILSGLVYAQTSNRALPVSPAPVVWDGENFRESTTVPGDRYWPAVPGAGCLLVHRRVLEAVGETFAGDAFPWFKYAQYERDGQADMMGEDFTFMLRCLKLGFTPMVDTTIECGHWKERPLRSENFWSQLPSAQRPRKLLAVVPVKDEFDHTRRIVGELAGEVDGTLVVDNGSQPLTANWLHKAQRSAQVVDMPDAGIHEMWNAGVEWARAVSPLGAFDLAILNNDVTLESGALRNAAMAIRENPGLGFASLNYDERPGDGVEFRSDICGERYDGTGGVAGFAFVVPSEVFDAGYRFPEDCRWWYGDNDLLMFLAYGGGRAGIVLDARCEHLDGGGATTGGWSEPARQELEDAKAADRAAFMARWAQVAGRPDEGEVGSTGVDPEAAA